MERHAKIKSCQLLLLLLLYKMPAPTVLGTLNTLCCCARNTSGLLVLFHEKAAVTN